MITNKTFDEIQIGDSARMQRVLTKQDIDVFGLVVRRHEPDSFQRRLCADAAGAPQAGRTQHVGRGPDLEPAGKRSAGTGHGLSIPELRVPQCGGTRRHAHHYRDRNIQECADGSVLFDCLAVNQRDEKIITGVARVKAPTKKPTDAGSPYASMQLHGVKPLSKS